MVAALPDARRLWVGQGAPPGVAAQAPRRLVRHLGSAVDALVLDLHGGLDPDVLACAQGLIWGGGVLLLRLPPRADGPPPGPASLALFPHGPEDVGQRLWARMERALDALPEAARAGPAPRAALDHRACGNPQQDAAIDALLALLTGPPGACLALVADRGRGKSAALGLALARARPLGRSVVVLGEDPAGIAEILRFAGPPGPGSWQRAAPGVLLAPGAASPDLVVVDEAARLSVALLDRLVAAHPSARFAFATTTHGYEGTGRGFSLRFLPRLAASGRPVTRLSLCAPIRWDAGDPLEAFVFDVLALNAEPAPHVRPVTSSTPPQEILRLHPDRLAADEGLLRAVFGLLVSAHYRTTPGDLHRLLDAPNLEVHALMEAGRVLAACLLAREGGFSPEWSAALARGEQRLRGHALADNLVVQAGQVAAGPLPMLRSVRIATHPDRRREGLARRLVEAVHQDPLPALFGTVFGATVDLLSFRRSLGYRLVRLGSSTGDRSGAPAAVMLRPVSAEAEAICGAMQRELAFNLPYQVTLLQRDGLLEPGLAEVLAVGLPPVAPPSAAEVQAGLAAYLAGPRRSDSLLWALRSAVHAAEPPPSWTPADAALVQGRLFDLRPWPDLSEALGLGGVPATQRALRRALSALRPG